MKTLYDFTLEKEVEVEKETTRKRKGETITTVKTVKEKKPFSIFVKQPNRRQIEEAEMEYSIEMSNCVKKGILTKAMLAKKYSDTGGVFSEENASEYSEIYKSILNLQNEFIRLNTVDKLDEKQSARLEKIKEELSVAKRKLIEIESTMSSLFDHTADVKAQNKLLLWYVLNLTYIQGEEDIEPAPFFKGESFQEKVDYMYEQEDGDPDDFYFSLQKKVTTIIAFWFFNQASSQEEFAEIIEKVEKGEL